MGAKFSHSDEELKRKMDIELENVLDKISTKGFNQDGNKIQFRPKDLEKLAKFSDFLGSVGLQTIQNESLDHFMFCFLHHAQEIVKVPPEYDTSHKYKTWTTLTDPTYYARTLPEKSENYYYKGFTEDEKKKMDERVKEYLNKYSDLKEKDTDSEEVKLEKRRYKEQLPHCFKIEDEFFTNNGEHVKHESTSYLLPAFGQWFVEQAFKTGPYPDSKKDMHSMNESEFKRQWGDNKIDLSTVYGATPDVTNALRLKKGGKLKTQKVLKKKKDQNGVEKDEYFDFPPKLVFGNDVKEDEVRQKDVKMFIPNNEENNATSFYALGHPRFNLHFALVFIQTIWIREHNDVCEMLHKNHPDWDDERLFQTARMICIAELCKVVVEDYIQHIMNLDVRLKFNPVITHYKDFQFAERAHFEFNYLYRWHSMVPEEVTLFGKKEKFADLRFKPSIIEKGMDEILVGLKATNAGKLSLNNTPSFLKQVETTTLIQSRCLKIESYNRYRDKFGLKEAKSFKDITGDEELQKKLQNIYEKPENVDWYVGIMAEDHLGDGRSMLGPTMQTMIGFYALSAIYSNPICTPHYWKSDVLTEEGFNRIKNTRLSSLINRTIKELAEPINANENPYYDCFSSVTDRYSPALNLSEKDRKLREKDIEKNKKKWPISEKSTPIHKFYDPNHKDYHLILKTITQNHSLVLARRQMKGTIKQIIASLRSDSVFSTLVKAFEIIRDVLSKNKSHIDTNMALQFIEKLDSVFHMRIDEHLIDKSYGRISKIFTVFDQELLGDMKWNQDYFLGETILNGLDPTQIRKFDAKLLDGDFKDFKNVKYPYDKFDLMEEIKNGNIYYLDLYETMNCIKSNPNIAKPRALFWYNTNTSFLPIAIQLNSMNKGVSLTVEVVNGENLPRLNYSNTLSEKGGIDPYVKIRCGKTKVKTQTIKNERNPVWNFSHKFECQGSDKLYLNLCDRQTGEDFLTTFKVDNIYQGESKYERICTGEKYTRHQSPEQGKITYKFVKKDNFTENPQVYTRDHNNWSIYKLFLGNAFVIHHELVSHNLKCHNIMEVILLSLQHSLHKSHPIHCLLLPHLFYTDTINLLARETLMKEGEEGIGLVSKLFSCSIDGNKINDHFYAKYDETELHFPTKLKERGVDLPRYYYKNHGMQMWDAIHEYVGKVITEFYTDQDIQNDLELVAFIKMLSKHIGKKDEKGVRQLIKIESKSDLIELLTSIIFNSTSQHTNLHYSQLDMLSFAPLLPTTMRKAPPVEDVLGTVEKGYYLNPYQQKILSDYLPTLGQSVMINTTFYPVVQPTDTPLIDEKYNLLIGDNLSKHFHEFQKRIIKISEGIKKEKKANLFHDMKNIYMANSSRSVNL